jgi:glyoxylate reductase
MDLLLGLELAGRQAVLVGRGKIGIETGRLFRAIGLKVDWITREDSDALILKKLSKAQVVSLHLPLTDLTRHWLNRRRLSVLPRDAIVINTSRGPVIDEHALIQALQAGRLFGAGLDVYEHEPKIPAELIGLKYVVLLPHLGSATRATRTEMMRLASWGVARILLGKTPWNQVKLARS